MSYEEKECGYKPAVGTVQKMKQAATAKPTIGIVFTIIGLLLARFADSDLALSIMKPLIDKEFVSEQEFKDYKDGVPSPVPDTPTKPDDDEDDNYRPE